jgi:hypothetical protein
VYVTELGVILEMLSPVAYEAVLASRAADTAPPA